MTARDLADRRAALSRIAAGAAAFAVAPNLLAQSGWPEKTITIVTPFGSAVDQTARLVAADLGKRLGAAVIVEQKYGGSGTIGMRAIARAPADGYVIGMGTTTSMTSAPHLMKNIGYDPLKSFTYLGIIMTSRQVLVVSPALGVNSIQELIALAKSKPGQLNFGSSGTGGSIHLAVELFNSAAGIKTQHIPFKTGTESDTAVLAGHVQYTIQSLPNSLALIQAGRLKALAVTGEGRHAALPDVVNLNEANIPGRIPDQFFGLVGPANMPPGVTARLLRAIAEMQAESAFQETIARSGSVPSRVLGDDFRKIAEADSEVWGSLIRHLGISLES